MKTSTDVANRALQNCGAVFISSGALWTEDSKNAKEVRNCYDSLRRAELRRNVWRFSVRRIPLRPVDLTTTYKLVPVTYSSTASYRAGTIVSYDNIWYIAMRDIAAGTAPLTSADWETYFGPVTVTPYDSTTTYYAGELVYTPSDTGYAVYLSTINSNADAPGTISAWAATTTYGLGETVTYSGVNYVSALILNLNNTPVAAWASGTTYAAAEQAVGTDGNIYASVAGSNTGHDPVTDTTHTYWTLVSVSPWTTVPSSQVGLNEGSWQTINATLEPLRFVYPAGVMDGSSRSVYMLPHGYLREAVDDPKAGSYSPLGAPGNALYSDRIFEDKYFTSTDTGVIVFRCAVDVTDVDKFDPLFYEGFACRIALEVCETLTQSATKLSSLAAKYRQFMGDARVVNAIEEGPTEPPLDDLISCRV